MFANTAKQIQQLGLTLLYVQQQQKITCQVIPQKKTSVFDYVLELVMLVYIVCYNTDEQYQFSLHNTKKSKFSATGK